MSGERERREIADLYTEARPGVVRYLIASGLDPDAAEEATQEAFLRLYTARRDGGAIHEPRCWVYRVARNVALNRIRHNSPQSAFTEAMEATMASTESSAEEQLIEEQTLAAFRQAIRNLSDRQRVCLELRAQGMAFREIAEVLGIKVSTACEFVRRGVEELKKWKRGNL